MSLQLSGISGIDYEAEEELNVRGLRGTQVHGHQNISHMTFLGYRFTKSFSDCSKIAAVDSHSISPRLWEVFDRIPQMTLNLDFEGKV